MTELSLSLRLIIFYFEKENSCSSFKKNCCKVNNKLLVGLRSDMAQVCTMLVAPAGGITPGQVPGRSKPFAKRLT